MSGRVVGWGDLVSACPHPQLSAGSRVDPYWDGLWRSGSTATWIDHHSATRLAGAGLAAVPAGWSVEEVRAWEVLTSPARRTARHRMLAVVDGWRTVSAEQAAAMTGYPHLAAGRSDMVSAAFTAGIIDIGVPASALYRTGTADRALLYRPSRTDAFTRRLAPTLTWTEWTRITGGRDWHGGGQFDRHNVLTTELGLRLAEYAEVAAVVGEKHSTHDHLVGAGVGNPGVVSDGRAADMTVIRGDGLRVAVELTASVGDTFGDKAHRWARLLEENPLATSGLVVLFVTAPPVEAGTVPGVVGVEARKAVVRAVRDHPGHAGDRTAARIGVAAWSDYFPAPGRVDTAFLTLGCRRPTGPPGEVWEDADLLDVAGVPFAPTRPGLTDVLSTIRLLGCVPHWLTAGADPPQLWPLLLQRAGLAEVPVPPVLRPNRSTRGRLGAGTGAAGDARPPARIDTRPAAPRPGAAGTRRIAAER